MERDGEVAEYDFCKRYFNSHAHVERDSLRNTARKGVQDFNSHAHVERDIFDNTAVTAEIISTHTLTWSVTEDLPPF